MSPRKSSTSSGKATPTPVRRPRYLGLEVAGELLPSFVGSPRSWEGLLADRLAVAGIPALRFRLIRAEGRRAIVEVDHLTAAAARAAWSASPTTGAGGPMLVPYRTWGTLLGAKAWLRGRREADGP
ncbi:MAG TPA: hypothetical protein VEH28_00435 [Thermoplasmata archaeon]|nr:hypothetical protein [Thermoplasmata archaeon]